MALSKILTSSVADTVLQTNKNLIINGSMTVSQRGDTTGQTGFAYSGPDRYQSAISSAGTWTISQSTTVPSGQGFANSLKLDCTTADGSLSAGDIFILRQPVEARNLQHLKYGTSSAEKLTISFWVRSNKTGTYWFELYHGDAAYHIAKTYTISVADAWQHKTITFDGYTPTSINNDNGVGLYVNWWLAAGSTYSGGSATSGSWHNTAANRVVGQVNLADSTSNEWYITGVQLEIGEVASPDFEHEDFGTTLSKCQRYFHRFQSDTPYDAFAPAYWLVTTQVYSVYEFPVTMRTQPSLAISATSDWRIHSNGGDGGLGSLVTNRSTPNNMQTYSDQSGATGTAGHAGAIRNNNNASAYIEFRAEL